RGARAARPGALVRERVGMKVRIVYDYSKSPHTTRIEDADTGAVIPGVRVVRFDHTAGEWPSVTLEIIKDHAVEVIAEGELEDVSEVGDKFARMRLVPAAAIERLKDLLRPSPPKEA